MGQNRRYPDHGAMLAEERELREAASQGPLQSLTPEQLELHRKPVTIAPERAQLTGRAWLRFGHADVRAPVRILRWTDDAVGVEVVAGGRPQRCWVWRGAVSAGRG